MNEAFRAEIDSLNAENAHLKQIGRERDRELADQRDKVEELTGKIGVFERERNAWTNTQIQLEDTIRELNRRLSSKTDRAPRNEWVSRLCGNNHNSLWSSFILPMSKMTMQNVFLLPAPEKKFE